MPQILLIDAEWDQVTKYLQAFREHLLKQDLKRHRVKHLRAHEAVQPNVDRFIRGNQVQYISAAGHGEFDIFKGYRDTPLWQAGKRLSHLNGPIVHFFSCRTGARLGPEIVANGARAFWGYFANFRFLRKSSPPADLHKDSVAESAIKMDCLIDQGILNGLRADVVYEQVRDYVDRESARLGPFNLQRAVLRHNYTHLVCPVVYYGDRSARLL